MTVPCQRMTQPKTLQLPVAFPLEGFSFSTCKLPCATNLLHLSGFVAEIPVFNPITRRVVIIHDLKEAASNAFVIVEHIN